MWRTVVLFLGALILMHNNTVSQDFPPPVIKGDFHTFQTAEPRSVEEWEKHKGTLRSTLWRLLGDLPPLYTPQITLRKTEQREGYALEDFTFTNGVRDTVYGYALVPDGRTEPGPAILYNHYHGGEWDNGKNEVITKAFGRLDFATGEVLVRQGYLVLCIDAYGFDERRLQGPAGNKEEKGKTQEALFKMFLWQGKTLWGMILHDDLLALNYLLARPDVDPARVAAMGMSMGSTRSWWLAAMDDRIAAVISVACLTRYQNFLQVGGRGHGIYYYVPDILKEKIDMEAVIGLIAPRPHLTLTGDQDGASPIDGVRIINAFQDRLYRLYGVPELFRGVVYPGVGHSYTPAMWDETIEWLKNRL